MTSKTYQKNIIQARKELTAHTKSVLYKTAVLLREQERTDTLYFPGLDISLVFYKDTLRYFNGKSSYLPDWIKPSPKLKHIDTLTTGELIRLTELVTSELKKY